MALAGQALCPLFAQPACSTACHPGKPGDQ